MAFRYLPEAPTTESVLAGLAQVNPRTLYKMLLALTESLENDTGVTDKDQTEVIEGEL